MDGAFEQWHRSHSSRVYNHRQDFTLCATAAVVIMVLYSTSVSFVMADGGPSWLPLMTLVSQTLAFLFSAMHFWVDYRHWSNLSACTSVFCLPVDTLLFYYSPFGDFGTMAAMVFAFVPFEMVNAQAKYGERGAQGQDNRWTNFTGNQRWNDVWRVTWAGYEFFGTLALAMSLYFHSEAEYQMIGVVIFVLEGLPKLLIMALTCSHWQGPVRFAALDAVLCCMDIPWGLVYLRLGCDAEIMNEVAMKLSVYVFETVGKQYAEYCETYCVEDLTIEDAGKYEAKVADRIGTVKESNEDVAEEIMMEGMRISITRQSNIQRQGNNLLSPVRILLKICYLEVAFVIANIKKRDSWSTESNNNKDK